MGTIIYWNSLRRDKGESSTLEVFKMNWTDRLHSHLGSLLHERLKQIILGDPFQSVGCTIDDLLATLIN